MLSHAIFQRVKTDARQTALGRQPFQRRVEAHLELLELAVDVNAQRLKNAGRGMLVALAAARHPRNHVGKLEGALERLFCAVGDDGARNARREALLAELAKNADQLLERRAVDPIGGAAA